MPTIQGEYYPSPEHERRRYWQWYCQLITQIIAYREIGIRTWHHEKAAERLLCWSRGESATHIKGI